MAKRGTEEFKRRLAKVPAQVRRAVDEAHRVSAAEFVATARSFAPVDPEDGTHLRDSIRHHATETGGQMIRAGGETTMRESPEGPYDYAMAQEFGTKAHRLTPYFWPAYRLLRKRFVSRRRRALNKALKEFSS